MKKKEENQTSCVTLPRREAFTSGKLRQTIFLQANVEPNPTPRYTPITPGYLV